MGRTSLLLVIGFNIIFATMGYNLSRVAIHAYENYISYYNKSVSHHIASSAANIAASQICFQPNWRTGYNNIPFEGGTFSVTAQDSGGSKILVTATATYNGIVSKTVVLLGLTKFSKFAYYSNIEGGIYWITGDTVWGPFHTQQKINVSGDPVFFGKATSKNGISKNPSSSKPQFYGGYQSGVNIDLPADLSQIQGFAQTGGAYFNKQDVYLCFNADGTVTYRIGSWTSIPAFTAPITTLAPNGVLVADNANLHIKGTVKGQITISALGSSGASKGNVWVDSSIAYATNPMTDPTSTDMLGIVCDNDVVVTDNADNNNPTLGVTIQASILCRSGGLTADNYNHRPVAGTLSLLGGVQQYQRGPVSTFSGSTINSGFQKNYRYDDRLMIGSPPLYPTTGTYEVLSWYE
jgi:hypothetical protein